MGFLVSAGIWVGSEGLPARPPAAPRRPPHAANVPPDAVALLPVVDSPVASSHSPRPWPRPLGGRPAQIETQPLDFGDLDDAYLPAWRGHQVEIPRRPPTPALRWPQSEGPSIQWQIDQTIDHIACYAAPAPRLPRIPEPVPPNRTGDTDPHPFTQRDVTEWGTVLGQAVQPRWPERPRASAATMLTRDSEQNDFYIAWAGQSIRPWEIARKKGRSESSQTLLVEFEFWFAAVQPNRPVPFHFRTNAAPPWLSMLSIAVPGPYYVIAGQVSPAAGALLGEVRAAGED
jgi:hypothetical protein